MSQNHEYEKHLGQISRICKDFRIDSLKPRLAVISENLQGGDTINVALIGRFKAGKSSFLNSLIGRDIMPVAVLPLTSVVTYVKYGPQDKAEVMFHNGEIKTIDLSELADFITEEKNPENMKEVARVIVEIVILREFEKINFVDTPGLGSVYKHNTLTSTGWLPKVGVAFLAVSIDHPLSEDDISLLKELDTYTSEIVILLTKIDLIPQKEISKVVDFIHKQVKQHLNRNIRIFPFSNKPDFEAERRAVYEFIFQYIAGNRLQKSKEIIKHKLHSTISKLLDYLQLASLAADSAQESREQLSKQLKEERQNLSTIENEIKIVSVETESRLHDDSYKRFQEFCYRVNNILIRELKEQLPNWKRNLDEVFQEWLRKSLAKQLEIISEELGPQLSEHYLNMTLTSFLRVVRAFQDRLAQDIEKALHTKFSGASFEVKIEKPKEPDLHLDFIINSLWETLLFAIPMRLFQPLLNRHFMSRIPWEAEKNLSRLSSQWVEAISCSIENMAKQAVEFINNEIVTIENILAEAPDQKKEIEKAILELEAIKTGIS